MDSRIAENADCNRLVYTACYAVSSGMHNSNIVLLWSRPHCGRPLRPGSRRSPGSVFISLLLLLCGDVGRTLVRMLLLVMATFTSYVSAALTLGLPSTRLLYAVQSTSRTSTYRPSPRRTWNPTIQPPSTTTAPLMDTPFFTCIEFSMRRQRAVELRWSHGNYYERVPSAWWENSHCSRYWRSRRPLEPHTDPGWLRPAPARQRTDIYRWGRPGPHNHFANQSPCHGCQRRGHGVLELFRRHLHLRFSRNSLCV